MDEEDKEKSSKNAIISFMESKNKLKKPSVFKDGVKKEWDEFEYKINGANQDLWHIITSLKVTCTQLEALISLRQDIKQIENHMRLLEETKDGYRNDKNYKTLEENLYNSTNFERMIGEFLKEENLKNVLLEMHEYNIIDLAKLAKEIEK